LTTDGPTKSTRSVKSGKPRTLGATDGSVCAETDWGDNRVAEPPATNAAVARKANTGVRANIGSVMVILYTKADRQQSLSK
jgi:hypothetical protein